MTNFGHVSAAGPLLMTLHCC